MASLWLSGKPDVFPTYSLHPSTVSFCSSVLVAFTLIISSSRMYSMSKVCLLHYCIVPSRNSPVNSLDTEQLVLKLSAPRAWHTSPERVFCTP
jgi:hypothetical protein